MDNCCWQYDHNRVCAIRASGGKNYMLQAAGPSKHAALIQALGEVLETSKTYQHDYKLALRRKYKCCGFLAYFWIGKDSSESDRSIYHVAPIMKSSTLSEFSPVSKL